MAWKCNVTNHKFGTGLFNLYINTSSVLKPSIRIREKVPKRYVIQCNSACMAQGVKCTGCLLQELSLDDETSQLFNATLHC